MFTSKNTYTQAAAAAAATTLGSVVHTSMDDS